MNTVGRIGSHISRHFHPFGGAVDIIVVEQQDGSLKSSNWKEILKKMVRFISPTSEQLASLNLKEGRNTVTFKFSTPMLGRSRSDVRGQFMPLVGVDWSHTGVAHLFSAIKADYTRQFLLDLKQDGKALPDGPVVICPMDSYLLLWRRSLFPSNCHPFYAGFGNRYTDEFSYLKVGIPQGKIFIINHKGEVAVNGRVAPNHTDPCMLMSMACSHPRPRRSRFNSYRNEQSYQFGRLPNKQELHFRKSSRKYLSVEGLHGLKHRTTTSQLPLELGHLSKLGTFNISHNNFSGSIPPSFKEMISLTSVDQLEGSSLITKPSFEASVGNKGLCGNNYSLKPPYLNKAAMKLSVILVSLYICHRHAILYHCWSALYSSEKRKEQR
ncbi:hypothetical protein FNV43_RR02459 [Rhamnella rubrinervis]|uniref:LNS2/PITP domain-containing protein n=1 Tax=Rhamnella rubrinervis TaxID=2594499 RepID=A0A8K0HTQ9_9ROSA|nr:hypothetical protein FNV43_RR02459 [Rhamnella rubrinervis]